MALPRKLKNFNVFYNAITHIGQCQEVQLPKLERETDDYRGGGLSGKVRIDLGPKELEIEHTYGGMMYDIIKQYGITTHDGVLFRFAGAYQKDDTGEVDAVDITVRGRHSEIDFGKAEAGGKTEFKVKTACSYFKFAVNGEVLVEIDLVHMIEVVGGVDRLATQRAAIGAN